MILVRDVFQLKFGKAKEAVDLWKEGMRFADSSGANTRLLTDLVGPYYTLVLERTYESLSSFEKASKEIPSTAEWRSWYARFLPLAEGGHREIFNVVS